MSETDEQGVRLTVAALGHRGEGVVTHGGVQHYLAYTAPGDEVQIDFAAGKPKNWTLTVAGPDRVTPPCLHFSTCGGCALQHLSDRFVAGWKAEQIARALRHRGIGEVDIRPIVTVPAASRRRVSFTARVIAGQVTLGFQAARSHRLVAVERCEILSADIAAALPGLRQLAGLLLSEGGRKKKSDVRISVNDTDTGLDILLLADGIDEFAILPPLTERAAALPKLARLSLNDTLVMCPHPPVMRFGAVSVTPPPGAFLQASGAGETALRGLVLEALGSARRIADLFAGCGTFSFPAAAGAQLVAVEGDAAMVSALDHAARHARGIKKFKAVRRDLFRSPLSADELKPFEAVIFDPPRAGGVAQVSQIAASAVRRVAAVSCAPATFARDARILIDGGFRLNWVAPVDQFRWSSHIELAAEFARPD